MVLNKLLIDWLIDWLISSDPFSLSHKPSYVGLKGYRIDHLDVTSLIKHIDDLKVFLADH